MPHGAIEWVEIPAQDVQEGARFYESVFGWKINREVGWEEYPMFMDSGGAVGGGFVSPTVPSAAGGVVLYITVDEIEAILPVIQAHGGKPAKEKTLIHETVGWWATFTDPSGNVVGLYQKALKG